MSEVYSSGEWRPKPGEEDAFVEAWSEFARWASGMPGAGDVRLVRDLSEPDRFVSFAPWESMEAMRAWKGSPEFPERMGRIQAHVAEFTPTELELVRSLKAGSEAPG